MSERLTTEQVRHVARLARLRLTPQQVEAARGQLADILRYVEQLQSLDVSGVEALTHPLTLQNRLAADEPAPSLTVAETLGNAPARELDLFAVPKVLGEGGGT